jgi:hypothetical protein
MFTRDSGYREAPSCEQQWTRHASGEKQGFKSQDNKFFQKLSWTPSTAFSLHIYFSEQQKYSVSGQASSILRLASAGPNMQNYQ